MSRGEELVAAESAFAARNVETQERQQVTIGFARRFAAVDSLGGHGSRAVAAEKRESANARDSPQTNASARWEFAREDYCQVRIRYRTLTRLGLLERFHRTLKGERIYWRLCDSLAHARTCLAEFRERYNEVRPHWALVPESGGDPAAPEDVYAGRVTPQLPRWQDWALAARH